MLTIAVLVFAIGALGGLYMASRVLGGHLAPWAVSLLHAALGATGLVLTGIVVIGPGGMTGIREVDSFIALWNPNGSMQSSRVWSPDRPSPRVTT